MKIRRITGIIVIVLIAVIAVSSCSGGKENEVFETSYNTGEVTNDLGGYEFVYKYGGDARSLGNGCLGYTQGTPLDDEALIRVKDVQSSLNCSIDIEYNTETYSKFVTSATSGVYYGDAVWMQSDGFRDLAAFGGVVGITGLEAIDHTDTEKWGNHRILEVMYIKDDLYGLVPCLWPEKIDGYICSQIAVNEDLIAKLAVTDPRDYAETGTWTWDKLAEVLPLYYLEEGGEVKHYGLTGLNAISMFYSNGNRNAVRNSAGEYVFAIESDRCFVAMNKAREFLLGDLAYTIGSVTVEDFVDNKSVLGIFQGWEIVSPLAVICNEMDNFGLIPFPIGPDAEPDYKFSYYANMEGSLAFSILAKDVDASATVVNALYEPIIGINNTQDMIDYLNKNYFFDPRDGVNLIGCLKGTNYLYFHYALQTPISAYCAKSSSLTQAIESNRNAADKIFTEQILPTINGINAVWGDGAY